MDCTFRSFSVIPMKPQVSELFRRISLIPENMLSIVGIYGDANSIFYEKESLVYIDSFYIKTTKYGFNLNIISLINSINSENRNIFVSESQPVDSLENHKKLSSFITRISTKLALMPYMVILRKN